MTTSPGERVFDEELFKKRLNSISTVANFHIYEDSDFEKPIVTDEDMAFFKYLNTNEDHSWELLGELSTKVNTYFSNYNFMSKVSFLPETSVAKFECIFPHPFEKVLCSIIPTNEFHSKNTTRVVGLDSYTHEDLRKMIKEEFGDDMHFTTKYGKRACEVICFDALLPFPMLTSRKYPVVSSVDYDPVEKVFTMVHKPCQHSSLFNANGKFDWKDKRKLMHCPSWGATPVASDCYFMFDFQSYQLQKLDEKRTSFKQIHIFDLSGWTSSSVTLKKKVALERGLNLKKALSAYLESKSNDLTIKSVKDELLKDPLGRLLVNIDIEGLDLSVSNSQHEIVEKIS